MVEIARRAGVGTATLYRRFPTRDDLFDLVFEDRIEACAATVDELLQRSEHDAWGAFAAYLSTLFRSQRADRAFTAALLHRAAPGSRMDEEQRRASEGLQQLIDRAKRDGLRQDLTLADVSLLLQAHQGVLLADGTGAGSERMGALLIEACRRP